MKNDKLLKIDEDKEMKDLIKSIYKSVLRNIRDKNKKKQVNEIVRDIEDPNYVAEVDPDKIPSNKTGIVYKSEDGIGKLKEYVSYCNDKKKAISQKKKGDNY